MRVREQLLYLGQLSGRSSIEVGRVNVAARACGVSMRAFQQDLRSGGAIAAETSLEIARGKKIVAQSLRW